MRDPSAEADYWRRKATRLLAAGDRKRAAAAFKRYLVAPLWDPELRAAFQDMKAGHVSVAATRLRRYLGVNPSDPVALRMLGQAAFNVASPKEAEALFRSVLEMVPGYGPVRFELASSLLLQGFVTEALNEADALLRREPEDASYLNLRAAALGKLGEIDAAIAVYERLRPRQATEPRFWLDYGNALRAQRRSGDAIKAFRHATSLRPEAGEAWWNLANMKTGELTLADLEIMGAALVSGKANPVDCFHLRFAIARVLEEQSEYALAFGAYKAANRDRLALSAPQRGSTTSELVERSVTLFTDEFMAVRRNCGNAATDPIFILGMPRSGSTLLEQILASHPLVEGTQELPDLPIIARHLDDGDSPMPANAYPEAIGKLSSAQLHDLGTRYLETTRSKRKTKRPFFLDKQPANWLHVGLIQLILPNARIIDMRRNALANCLSIFRQHFARGFMYGYAIESLAAEYRGYDRMMRLFDEVAPGRIKHVRLEDVVADVEGAVRELLDSLGLPFADECLRFFESDRAVFTPSSEQVRRPINDEAAALFAGFQPHIDELRNALGPLANC